MVTQYIQNFTVGNQVNNTSVGTTATTAVKVATNINFADCLIVNDGTNGAQVAFGDVNAVAVNSASAGGTSQIYVPGGQSRIVGMNTNQYFSAITDTGTTKLFLHAGQGS